MKFDKTSFEQIASDVYALNAHVRTSYKTSEKFMSWIMTETRAVMRDDTVASWATYGFCVYKDSNNVMYAKLDQVVVERLY